MKLLALPLVASLLATSSALPVLEDRGPAAVTTSEFSDFKYYAQYAAAAYCNSGNAIGQVISCSQSACPTVAANRAVTASTFKGSLTDIRGMVAVDSKASAIVVSFRGSTSILNWIANLQFLQTRCDLVNDCYVHTGFMTAWQETSAAVLASVKSARAANPSYRVVATGHSLGGAVATLAAAYLRRSGIPTDLYTYGSPRVGNPAFASFVTAQAGAEWRVTHGADPVPRLPPAAWGYQHTVPEYWLGTGGPMTTNYAAGDVKLCQGLVDAGCNAGTLGLDIIAHLFYLGDTTACNNLLGRGEGGISDEELEARVNAYAKMDLEYAAGLRNGSVAAAATA